MSRHAHLDQCETFINCHLQSTSRGAATAQQRAVTISRQSGCGAHKLAEILAAWLEARSPGQSCPWTVFDRDVVEKALEDHNLPARLARFMPEDRVSAITDAMEEIFGLHPPTWLLVRKTSETIFHLAELGNVILIGRGASIITRRLKHIVNVRLVGSPERRLERMRQFDGAGGKITLASLAREDRGRERYVKRYFHHDPNDPMLYHLVINTDHVSLDDAARMVGELVLAN